MSYCRYSDNLYLFSDMPFYKDHLSIDDPDLIQTPMMGIAVDKTQYLHPMHHHKKIQLLFCHHGIIEINTKKTAIPSHALLLPSLETHRVKSKLPFSLRSLYIDPYIVD